MSAQRYLLDKSALGRWGQSEVAPVLDELSERGLLCITGAVQYEVLYSARNTNEARRLRLFLSGFDYLFCGDEVWERALEVLDIAMAKGFHRALSMADVLIAATAERHGATVLHYDGDFDMIASITKQSMRWVAPPGTAD